MKECKLANQDNMMLVLRKKIVWQYECIQRQVKTVHRCLSDPIPSSK